MNSEENTLDQSTMTTDSMGNRIWMNAAGEYHRVGGPAAIYANGDKHWYIHDELHRMDGPAVENANGERRFYLRGKQVTEAEALAAATPLQSPTHINTDGLHFTSELL